MRGLAQSLDYCHRKEIAVREEDSMLHQFLRHFNRRQAVHGESHRRCARCAGRWTVKSDAFYVGQPSPKPGYQCVATLVQLLERSTQAFAARHARSE